MSQIQKRHLAALVAKKVIPMEGRTFGRLTVLCRSGSVDGKASWLCRCKCAKQAVVSGRNLRQGNTGSCGCLQRERTSVASKTHGEAPNLERHKAASPEYTTWCAMKSRCKNPNNSHFSDYGGRGIRVCARWNNSFEAFLSDMGRKPSPQHSIDRFPDNNGDYEPSNCRWATKKEQNSNQRKRKDARI